MTEQIITKNFYSIVSAGGIHDSSYAKTSLMPKTLSRKWEYATYSNNNNLISSIKSVSLEYISNFYHLQPVKFSKLLSDMTESEIYSTPYENIFTRTSYNCYAITDSSTDSNTGIKLVTTHTNNGDSNEIINGVMLIGRASDNDSTTYNLILTKFDKDIILAPTESYSFTLDLPNLFQTFPATLGS